MPQIKKILCATDLSKFSDDLLSLGVELCMRFDALFLIFHAVPPPHGSVAGRIEFERGGEKKEQIESARDKIQQCMAGFNIKWESIITYGDPVLETARAAKKANADIILAASHGLSGVQQFFIGSVIGRMAQTVLHPFLVIPPGKTVSDEPCSKLELKNIIIACSLTHSDLHLKKYAVAFSEKFNSKICLIHVMESPVNKTVRQAPSGHYDDAQRCLEEKLSLKLSKLMPGKTIILHGVPGEELALYAKNNGVGLIIAGIDEHPGRITTTASLIRYLPCAVLTVPIKL
jgi:nucleotide-binding universal stress UspA family protein